MWKMQRMPVTKIEFATTERQKQTIWKSYHTAHWRERMAPAHVTTTRRTKIFSNEIDECRIHDTLSRDSDLPISRSRCHSQYIQSAIHVRYIGTYDEMERRCLQHTTCKVHVVLTCLAGFCMCSRLCVCVYGRPVSFSKSKSLVVREMIVFVERMNHHQAISNVWESLKFHTTIGRHQNEISFFASQTSTFSNSSDVLTDLRST